MTKGKNNTGNAKGKVAATQPTPEPEAPKGPAERLAAELARFARSISMRADRTERWGDATIHHGKDKREILLGHEVRQRLKEASALINTGVDLLLEAPRGWRPPQKNGQAARPKLGIGARARVRDKRAARYLTFLGKDGVAASVEIVALPSKGYFSARFPSGDVLVLSRGDLIPVAAPAQA